MSKDSSAKYYQNEESLQKVFLKKKKKESSKIGTKDKKNLSEFKNQKLVEYRKNNLFWGEFSLLDAPGRPNIGYCRRFFLLVQTKEVVFMSYGSCTNSYKPCWWMRADLISMMGGTYTSVPTFTHPQRLESAAEAPSLEISSYGTFLKWSWRAPPISKNIIKSSAMKSSTSFEFEGKSIENEATAWQEFPIGGRATVEKELGSEETKKSKRIGLWESQLGILVGKLTNRVRSNEMENCNRVHLVDQFYQSKLIGPYNRHWMSKDK